jgi:hypothetical protein
MFGMPRTLAWHLMVIVLFAGLSWLKVLFAGLV